jgi:hypothetical protein
MSLCLNKNRLTKRVGCSDINPVVLRLLGNFCLIPHLLPQISDKMLKLIPIHLPKFLQNL